MHTTQLAANHSDYSTRTMTWNVIICKLLQHSQINVVPIIWQLSSPMHSLIKLWNGFHVMCPQCEYSLHSRFQCLTLSNFHACFFADIIVLKFTFWHLTSSYILTRKIPFNVMQHLVQQLSLRHTQLHAGTLLHTDADETSNFISCHYHLCLRYH